MTFFQKANSQPNHQNESIACPNCWGYTEWNHTAYTLNSRISRIWSTPKNPSFIRKFVATYLPKIQ